MDIFSGAERLMAMNDETWERRANPLSVYSRFLCLPLIVAAIWSRTWLGWWAVVPLALAIGWTFLNPRLFSAPIGKGTEAAKAVMGERLFLARETSAVPQRHASMAHWLTALSLAGAVVLAYGVIMLDARATLAGLAVAMTGKLWFCDRMVWLYEDMDRSGNAVIQGAIARGPAATGGRSGAREGFAISSPCRRRRGRRPSDRRGP